MIYKDENLNELARAFAMIEDPRDNRGFKHKLIDIFILTVFGSLWGHVDFTNMVEDLKYKEEYFTKLLGLKHGIPSHDTFSAVFSIINPEIFLECFMGWIATIINTKGHQIAIDGKAIRAACQKVYNKRAPYIVNTLIVEAGLCIGQIKIDEKTNEIVGIPEMMKWLDLDGAIVTIDAIGCQKEIVRLILEKKGDFVLPVKENQKTLHKDISLEMETRIAEKKFEEELTKQYKEKGIVIPEMINSSLDEYIENDWKHGRMERRKYYILNDNACIDNEDWIGIKSVGLVVRERLVIKKDEKGEIIEGEPTIEKGTYIISKTMSAEEFASYVRGHWRIENSLHWVLDDQFR